VTGKSVIVVGAGLAGLAAASKLQKLGASVRILEARNRTGGRIKTDYSLGIPLELGPSWIHARKGNPLEPLLARAGLTTVKASYKTRARNIVNGKQDLLANKELRELQRVLEDENNTRPKTSLSMAAWLGQNSWSGKSEMQRWASDVELTQDFGLSDSNFGVKAYFEGRDYLGGDGLIAGGLNNLTDMLAENLDIELNRPVVSVSPTGSGVRVELQSGLPKVLGLALKVQLAIDSLETGNLEKVALVFSQSWWVRPETKVPVLGVTGDKRWSAFYDMSEVVGAPTLFGLTGGQRSTTRPKNDQACLREAQDAVVSAWRPHRE
jgi:phytoene dehydrogenase-like protein